MELVINAAGSGTALRNFWNNMHFHPTDAVEDLWGREILDRVAADRSAQYVRLYTMFEDIVTRDETGKLVFDFSDQDRRLDYMVSKGFKILLCFNFMPVAMGKTPTELSGRRYKDKHFCRSNPADYDEWKQLCHTQAKHLIDRYGEDEVASWRMHCWNEPDLGYWIYPKFFCDCTPEEREYKMAEYCKLFDHFEAGVHEASPRLQAGGPSCGHYKEFFEYVMRHVSAGRNFVTGATGTRMDFVSLHCYSSIPQDVHDPYRFKVAPESIVHQYRTYRGIMEKYGLGGKPVIIDEWAAAAEGYLGIDRDPRMRFRETEYYSAFYFRLIDLLSKLPQSPERMMICLSGQDRNTCDFDGHRTFFTAHGWSKPLYNAFVMAARLGGERLPVEGACSKNCGIIATRHLDGRIAAVLYNHESDFGREGGYVSEPVRLALRSLPGKFHVERRRIDRVFSNAFTAWSRLGSPAAPNVWERELISRRSRLEKYRPDETGSENWTGEILLPPNSVELLEFIPE